MSSLSNFISGALGGLGIGGTLISNSNAINKAKQVSFQDPYAQGQAMLAAQLGTAPSQYNAYAQYAPQYAGADSAAAAQQFGASASMFGQYNPYINALNNASNTAYQQAIIGGVDQYGQQVANQYRTLNPELYASLNTLSSTASQPTPYATAYGAAALAGSPYSTDISRTLGQQAADQLALGSTLTPAEQRDATQAARAAASARGLTDSNSTIGAEILNNYTLGQQRLQQRQQFAQNILGQNQGYLQGADALNQQQYQQQLAAANAWGQNAFNPYASILGQQSGNQLTSAQIAAQNYQAYAPTQAYMQNAFNPYNQYASNLYGANQSAQNQSYLTQAGIYNNQANNFMNMASKSLFG